MRRSLLAGMVLLLSLSQGFTAVAAGQGPPPVTQLACSDTAERSLALAAVFPAKLRSQPLEVVVCDGPGWLASYDRSDPDEAIVIERAEALLQSVGKTIDDLTVASAVQKPDSGPGASVTAFRVDGARASHLVDPTITLMLGITRPKWATMSRDDREFIVMRGAGAKKKPPTLMYHTYGDTLWVVTAGRRLAEKIISTLPRPNGRVEISEFGLAVTFPEDWTVWMHIEPVGLPEGIRSGARAWMVLAAAAPENGNGDRAGSCFLQVFQSTGLTTEEFAAVAIQATEDEESPYRVHDSGLISRAGEGSFYGSDVDSGSFLLGSDGDIAALGCMNKRAPRDGWFPIADSMALNPVARAAADVTPEEAPRPADETPQPSFGRSAAN